MANIYDNYILDSKIKNTDNSYFFVFEEDMLLLINNQIPLIKDIDELDMDIIRKIYIGEFYSKDCYAVEVSNYNSRKYSFFNLNELYSIDEELFLLAGRAIQIINWDKNHEYCGRCGSKTFTSDVEMAKVCGNCGFFSFTRISPAIITAIIKDNTLLMAKHSYNLVDRYVLIAGFIEAGETIEEAVHREIKEEVGINVKNLRYFSSQSWPFPNSLMIGFICEYDIGEIKVDNHEIIDAKWFKKEEIDQFPSNISISSQLVQYFIDNY